MSVGSLSLATRYRLSATLSGYIFRLFLSWFLGLLLAIGAIIFLGTVVDLTDRMGGREAITMGFILELSLLKLPNLSQEFMPFIILFASLGTFWRLTRTHEMVVIRSTGVSIWQFLLPVLFGTVVISALTVGALNPLSAATIAKFRVWEDKILRGKDEGMSLSSSGLWLRQGDLEKSEPSGHYILHATRAYPEQNALERVIIFRFNEDNSFTERLDAERAEIRDGAWRIRDGWRTGPAQRPEQFEVETIPTELSMSKIEESFARAETISFWGLPNFIEILRRAGFSAVAHELQLHRLLSLPLLFLAMVLLSASTSLRPHRRGYVGLLFATGAGSGFFIFTLSRVIFALGLSGKIPVVLAAWTPAVIALMLGVAMLLHLEDG